MNYRERKFYLPVLVSHNKRWMVTENLETENGQATNIT